MSKLTGLASSQITTVDLLTTELIEADEAPAVVIVRWPVKGVRTAPSPVRRCC
jgi:hypothetical protein